MMSDEQENKWREEFEELQFKYKNNLDRSHNGYIDGDIHSRWMMYEAARKKAKKELKDKDDLIIILKMKFNGLKEKVKELEDQLAKKDELIKERDAEIDNLVLTNKIIGNDKECFKLEIKRQKGEIDRFKGLLEKAKIVMLSWCDRNECDADDIHEWFKQYEELKK